MSKITLSALNSRLGTTRKKLAVAVDERTEMFAEIDARREQIDALEAMAELNAEQSAEYDVLVAADRDAARAAVAKGDEISSLQDAVASLQAELADRQAHNGLVVGLEAASDTSTSPEGAASPQPRVLPPSAEQLDHDIGQLLQAQCIAQIDHSNIVDVIRGTFDNERVEQYAAVINDHTKGGSWVSGVFSDRFIELLRPASIVRSMGVDTVPLDDGSLTMPKETAGPSGEYLGETEDSNAEDIGTGDVKLVAKELVCTVAASEKLLRSPSANAASRILRQIVRGAGQTEDLYFLRGTANGAGPTGLRYLANSANVFAMNATVNLANVTKDLGMMELKLLEANVVSSNPAWIMAPRTLVYLMDLRDGNGNYAFPSLQSERPILRNKPVFVSTQIPVNLGGGTESEIMLVEGTYVVIGDVPAVGIEASKVAAYKNASGTLVAAFSKRQVVTRLVMENDQQVTQDKAISVLTGVTWGA